MSIEEYFESGEEKQIKGHFANLIKIANADGTIDEKEEQLLKRMAKNFQITDYEFEEMINHSSDYSFYPPVKKEERYERFVNLIRMVVADEEVSDFEMKTLKRFAAGLDMPLLKLENLVNEIINDLSEGEDVEEIVHKMNKRLK